jgi:hypothetical protein
MLLIYKSLIIRLAESEKKILVPSIQMFLNAIEWMLTLPKIDWMFNKGDSWKILVFTLLNFSRGLYIVFSKYCSHGKVDLVDKLLSIIKRDSKDILSNIIV